MEPTQVVHPWKAAVRTAIQTFFAVAAIATLALPAVVEFVEQFWPGSPAIAFIVGAGAFVAAVAGLLTRIMAIPAVNDLLTVIGLGAEPKL